MDNLEELLSLLQTYGVTEYSDKELKLTLVHTPPTTEHYDDDDDDFHMVIEQMHVSPPEPNN